METVPSDSQKRFYSESPGMIIDMLAILFIKLFVIRQLLSVIKEESLKKEYREKEDIISKQINHLGNFLDFYFNKLEHKEIFFEIQQPVKIYNNKRIKKYNEEPCGKPQGINSHITNTAAATLWQATGNYQVKLLQKSKNNS